MSVGRAVSSSTSKLRRAAVLAAFLIVSIACAGGEPASAPPRQVARYDAATLFDTTSIRGGSFSADEKKVLLSTDASGSFDVYVQPTDGTAMSPLVQGQESLFAVAYFPHDDRVLYTGDQGGNELNHLYVREPDGSTRDLTPGERLKASFFGWSGDKKSFYVQSNERDARYFDVYRYDTDGYTRELLFQNDGFLPSDISRDGRWLALDKVRSNVDSDVYLLDLRNGETTRVTPHDGNVTFAAVTFTPDSRELYYSTDGEGEFTQIWSYAVEGGERKPVLQADWDVMYVGFSENGRYRVSAINEDARTRVTVREEPAGNEVALPELGGGDVQRVVFSPSETKMLFYASSDTSPSDLYLLDLEAEKPEPLQLTHALSASVDRRDLVDGEVVRFASYDDLQVPGILYRPLGADAEHPVPAMLFMHGGPGGQSRKGYREEIQHLVNHGYAVFAVNNRGSSGYGKTFFHMDDRRHGEADLQDCVWARRYLESLDWIDGDRIGIMGGSYGGYLVAAALALEPEAFDVGVDIFGVTNWVRTLGSMPAWWGAQRDALFAEMGDPASDGERLRKISPLFHADQIRRPLLVVQGANDPRVLQVESDELVAAVRKSGVPVEYVVFPDEGHGFTKKENRIASAESTLRFLDRYLRGEDGGEAGREPATGG